MSSSDSIRSYLDARQACIAAQREVETLVEIVFDAASKLRQWKVVTISGCDVGFPLEVGLRPAATIDANQWPTARQLALALAAWHDARFKARNLWDTIPEGDRSGLQPPPAI